jgi:hypothetical protein
MWRIFVISFIVAYDVVTHKVRTADANKPIPVMKTRNQNQCYVAIVYALRLSC